MNLFIATCVKLGIIGIGIAVGAARNKSLTDANRMFWLFLLVAFAGEVLEFMMGRIFVNNYVYHHVFRPLYYAFLTLALANEMGRLRKPFLITIPVVAILAFLNAMYLQPPDKTFNTLIIVLTCLLLILQVLFYIAQLFDHHNWQETAYQYSLWIALGILIHSISSFLTLGIYNVMKQDGHRMTVPFLVISEWLFYGSFVLNFWLQHKSPTTTKRL
ncbi:hypothetical protein [Flavihumibacter petaseus]|uniref:Uncharacterized protein n=1 Tax=Flavihumibacter petaseus NBRC 106054 TaxID=1220578 RepID=A0A0E9MZZ7_9BACT|nr:hypothetical protein [Flavihumibacter petaseus]GAO42951.1 hypothetical protein FPE01S_02_00560 [Flavihumibacter petaseus NBRC 106054]